MAGLTVFITRMSGLALLTCSLLLVGCGKETPKGQKPTKSAAAKAAPAPPAVQSDQQASPATVYRYNPEGRRDPFRSLLVQETAATKKGAAPRMDLPPLQRYGVEEFVLGGITWDEKSAMALVRGPDGKGYILKPGTLLGPNGGIVKKITPTAVEVYEKTKDYRGKETTRVIMLELHRAEEDKK
ncbi:MAG: pilus assembly protein PilP [Nitrospirota bacterium]|nr:pilus assembly protein PilP [Nitrospirota bacterium]